MKRLWALLLMLLAASQAHAVIPAVSKTFSPTSITVGGISTLTLTIANGNSYALTSVAFTDVFPSGLAVATTPALTNSCGGSVTGGTAGSGTLSLSNGTIAASGSCSITVAVTASTDNVYSNTAGGVSGDQWTGSGSASNTASLTVLASMAPPTITMSYSANPVGVLGTSVLTITITNPNSTTLTGIAFTDTYPAGGMGNVLLPATSNTCGGTATGASLGSSLSLASGTLAGNSSCTVSTTVASGTAGVFNNVTSAITSTNGGTGTTASGTFIVSSVPFITKSFSPTRINTGGTSTLTLSLTNVLSLFQSNVAFTDSFPAGLVVAATPALSNTCGGTITGATAGSGSIALSGGSIGILSVCTITVAVTSASQASYANTTGALSSATGTYGVSNTATLTVDSIDLQVKKSHSGAFTVGSTGTYAITVNNAGTGPTSGTITVTDTLPAGLAYVPTGSGGTGWSCGAAGQVVTCTSTASIAASGTAAAIALNVSVAATAAPSVTNLVSVAGGGESAAYTNNNMAGDYTLVANPAQTTFSTAGQQVSAAGTVVFYPHTFLAGYAGNVTFSAANTATPSISGWSSAPFADTNCNGILDGGEGSTILTGSVTVAAGGQVCIIEEVFIPASATYGAKNETAVTAAFTPTSTGSSATLTQSDVTTVGAAGTGLTLQKTVRNVTTGGTAAANNIAASGQTLEYAISYSNASATSLTSVVVRDATPPFTVFVSAQCVTPLPSSITACNVTTQPSVGGQGTLVWTLTGSLQSGATGSVLFRVTLQ
jgi:uncharacterized repeat protein (TIGR01451 family)